MRPTRKMWEAMAWMYAVTITILMAGGTYLAVQADFPVRNQMGAAIAGLHWFLVAWARYAKRWERWDVLVTFATILTMFAVLKYAP